jgi:hypothetical protein
MKTNKYTPIKDRQTKEPILLGDLVKNEKSLTGYLYWCDYYNRYMIKSINGGNIYSRTYTKIKELKENNIDTTNVECRNKQFKKNL